VSFHLFAHLLNGCTDGFDEIFKEVESMLLKLLHETERKGMLPNSLNKASFTLMLK
jgi:hypothetical protein